MYKINIKEAGCVCGAAVTAWPALVVSNSADVIGLRVFAHAGAASIKT